jgi:hypothetical protein
MSFSDVAVALHVAADRLWDMCRSIKVWRNFESPPTDEDIEAAALQFVRKISGYRQPSKRNEAVFQAAVVDITRSSRELLEALQPAHSSR